MGPTRPPTDDAPNDGKTYRRRRFLAIGTTAAATVLAGCSAGSEPGGRDGGGTRNGEPNGESTAAGTFQLLISDRPADIADFDSLDVSFDRARIVRADGGESDATTEASTASKTETAGPTGSTPGPGSTSSAGSTTATGTAVETPASTPASTAAETEEEGEGKKEEEEQEAKGEEGDESDEQGGFLTLDLGGATVDLTEVVGEKAIAIGEEEVPEGRYAKIELYAAGVEGVVDGDPVDVKIPSGKLQIVKPFEVEAGKRVSFVFDINVVKKGRSGEYNLLPVISESGVAGKDVTVDEVGNDGGRGGTPTEERGPGEATDGGQGDGNGGNDSAGAESNGPPDGGGGGSQG